MSDDGGNNAIGGRSNGSGMKVQCSCCGSWLALSAANGVVRFEAEAVGSQVPAAAGRMFIDPHAHMISRTTDDYQAMARAGVAAVIEPAFWIGQPRTNLGSYVDYGPVNK